ncbi:MAG TPA: hypothetical protein PL098_00170 [Brevundimonas diminuta]|nr:hypothetical protein [Brevundimonas diminuta]HRL23319.1 hypothetical protein [Brevundimonas diminuta]
MPISSTSRKAGPFYGNGAATTFTFDFKIFEPSELRVVRFSSALGVDLDLVAGVDYSITLNPDQDEAPGGEVILAVAPAIGDRVVLLSDVPDLQPMDLTNQGGFYPDLLNGGLDRSTIQVQQLREEMGRAIKLPPTAEDGEYVLPLPQGNKLLAWGQDGKTITNLDPGELISVVTYGNTKADVFEGDGTSTAFALSASPGSVNNLAISIDGVVQVPEIDYAWGGGKSLVFAVPPPAGTRIFVRYQEALDEGTDVSGKADRSGDNITDPPNWREGLGLGDAATKDVGTGAGSVAAGDDARLSYSQGGPNVLTKTLQDKARQFPVASDWSGANYAQRVMNAANALASGGGGDLYLDIGIQQVPETIIMPAQVTLRGRGRGIRHDVNANTPDAATGLMWSGASGAGTSIIQFVSPPGAGNRGLGGGGVVGVGLYGGNDGRARPDHGIKVRGWKGGEFDAYVENTLGYAWDWDAAAGTLGEEGDTQENLVHRMAFKQLATDSGGGVRFGGNYDANVSVNLFNQIVGQHRNGHGIYFNGADNIYVPMVRLFRSSGAGYAVVFGAGATERETARGCRIGSLTPGDGYIWAQGTENGTVASTRNRIDWFDDQSGTHPLSTWLVKGAGADIIIHQQNGFVLHTDVEWGRANGAFRVRAWGAPWPVMDEVPAAGGNSMVRVEQGDDSMLLRALGANPNVAFGVSAGGNGPVDLRGAGGGTLYARFSEAVATIAALPALSFANDAAAATGGVAIGGLYHTSGAVKVRLT